jgi:hypothetical protein
LPEARIPALEASLARFKPDSVGYRLTAAELALARQDYDAAKRTLADAVKGYLLGKTNSHSDTLRLLTALLAVREFALTSTVAQHAYGLECEIATLAPLPAAPPGQARRLDTAVLVRIEKSGCRFTLNEHIYETNEIHTLDRLCGYFDFFAKYLKSDYADTGSVYLNLGDAGVVPGLAAADYREGYFLIPDPLFCRSRGQGELKRLAEASWVPWEERIAKVVWRGTCSGDLSRGGWRSLQRIRLCEIGATSDLFDVGVTRFGRHLDERAREEITASGLMRPSIPSFSAFKFQVDVPGNGNSPSWSGLIRKLSTGNVVLKLASWVGVGMWYFDRLKPWYHFVPVSADLSDIVEKAVWLSTHDAQARQIGMQGREFVQALEYETELPPAFKTVRAAMAHHSYAFPQ